MNTLSDYAELVSASFISIVNHTISLDFELGILNFVLLKEY